MNIPFVDLKAQYQSIKSEIDKAIATVIEETSFIGGPSVKEFENKFKALYGVKHCVGLANGTDAIYATLKMLGIKEGDEVITVANSWISTSETITQAGAKPIFVDIDPTSYTIDPTQIEKKITSKTKAIIPVHIYGQAAHIHQVKDIALRHNLHLIEDCAQSHFTEENKVKVGTLGIAGTFSFYPGKNLGAYGDAGAIITNDDSLAEKIRMYANHGSLKKHEHQMEGINSRLDSIQAAILSVKADYILDWTQKRIEHAKKYSELLKDVTAVVTPTTRENTRHTFHLYVIRTNKRDELKKYLEQHSIQTAIHYPRILPNLPAYAYLGHKPHDFPVAYKFQNEILSLPMYPELTDVHIEYVCEKIRLFFKS
jgi:dTDP-4-amino-4,6-dideoxygalactose transaminase